MMQLLQRRLTFEKFLETYLDDSNEQYLKEMD